MMMRRANTRPPRALPPFVPDCWGDDVAAKRQTKARNQWRREIQQQQIEANCNAPQTEVAAWWCRPCDAD